MFPLADESALFRGAVENYPAVLCRSDDEMIDLEFSDHGRSRRFVAGWWLVPGVLVAIAMLGLYIIS